MRGPEREADILIVGDQRETARTLRGVLEQGEQGYVVHNVLSGEEAILELGRLSYRLIIAETRLPGISGVELLQRVQRRWPTVSAILIDNDPSQDVQGKLAKAGLEVAAVFPKPLDASAIAEAVHRLLGGRLPAAEGSAPMGTGRLSDEQKDLLGRRLEVLRTEIGAQGVALISHEGRILLREGTVEELPRFRELAVLLANALATTADIAAHLGERPPAVVHYYQGDWSDLFVLTVGYHHILIIVFPGGSQRQMGAVLRYGKPAAQEIAALMEGSALPAARPVPSGEGRISPPQATEAPAAPLPTAEGGATAPIALDLSLDDLGALDTDTGELDRFWEAAAADSLRLSDDALSLDEAVEQGLFPGEGDLG